MPILDLKIWSMNLGGSPCSCSLSHRFSPGKLRNALKEQTYYRWRRDYGGLKGVSTTIDAGENA